MVYKQRNKMKTATLPPKCHYGLGDIILAKNSDGSITDADGNVYTTGMIDTDSFNSYLFRNGNDICQWRYLPCSVQSLFR